MKTVFLLYAIHIGVIDPQPRATHDSYEVCLAEVGCAACARPCPAETQREQMNGNSSV
jgi:hypothetical protein